MIIFIATGFWRWGVAALCAVTTALNLVEIAAMVASGADPLVATITAFKVSFVAGVIVLPIAAMVAWLWREVSVMVGGLLFMQGDYPVLSTCSTYACALAVMPDW